MGMQLKVASNQKLKGARASEKKGNNNNSSQKKGRQINKNKWQMSIWIKSKTKQHHTAKIWWQTAKGNGITSKNMIHVDILASQRFFFSFALALLSFFLLVLLVFWVPPLPFYLNLLTIIACEEHTNSRSLTQKATNRNFILVIYSRLRDRAFHGYTH